MTAGQRSEIKVAVIGAGFISDYHVNGLRAAGGARVAALVGRDRDRTEARARRLGIERSHDDHRAVLDDPTIEAVVVATPDATHEAIAIAALGAGKAVMLQKPMALDSRQCRNILEAERRTGTLLTVSFMHRYFPEVVWLRDLLRGGALGAIQTIRIRNATPGADWADWFYAAGSVSGGVVMQLGVHGIDLCHHLFGAIEEVSARLMTARPSRTLSDGRVVRSSLEDNALASYRFAEGVLGSHEMSYTELAGCDRFRLEVYAENGTAWLRTGRGPAALFAPAATGRDEWVAPALAAEPMGALQHRRWLEMIRGEAPRDDTPEAGLRSLLVVEAIYRSAGERRPGAVERS